SLCLVGQGGSRYASGHTRNRKDQRRCPLPGGGWVSVGLRLGGFPGFELSEPPASTAGRQRDGLRKVRIDFGPAPHGGWMDIVASRDLSDGDIDGGHAAHSSWLRLGAPCQRRVTRSR